MGKGLSVSSLFPHGMDVFNRLASQTGEVHRGPVQDLVELLRRRDLAGRIAFLLCGTFLPVGSDMLVLPPVDTCRGIISVVTAWQTARGECCHRGAALWNIPPTLLGRIARSTTCGLDPRTCVTMVLSLAVSVPAILCEKSSVGFISLPEWPRMGKDAMRWVTIGKVWSPGATEICTLSTSRGALRLSIRDCQEAAASYPLSLSTLRAALAVGSRRRLLRGWRAPIATDPIPQGPRPDFMGASFGD